jgi:hypothetical protein
VKDSTPIFRIYDEEGFRLRTNHRMVFRTEGQTDWQFFDHGAKPGTVGYYTFYNEAPFESDTIYIAFWYPYTLSDLESYLESIETNAFVQNLGVRGESLGGRPIYGYQVTDNSVEDSCKLKILITGRQHSVEFTQSYILEGMTNYLINSPDSLASELRQHCVFYFYPMMNPDGVVLGLETNLAGSGLNREWEQGFAASGNQEVDVVRAAILSDCGPSADFSIDLHGNTGHQAEFYWWGQTSGPDSIHVLQAARYVRQSKTQDSLIHAGASKIAGYIQGDTYGGTAKTAANWAFNTLEAVSFTFEPASTSVPPIDYDRLYNTGAALAQGFGVFQAPDLDCMSVRTTDKTPNSRPLVIYPNPASDEFYLTRSCSLAGLVSFYSVGGRLLHQEYLDADTNQMRIGKNDHAQLFATGGWVYVLIETEACIEQGVFWIIN